VGRIAALTREHDGWKQACLRTSGERSCRERISSAARLNRGRVGWSDWLGKLFTNKRIIRRLNEVSG
jgi:hypothetical protein